MKHQACIWEKPCTCRWIIEKTWRFFILSTRIKKMKTSHMRSNCLQDAEVIPCLSAMRSARRGVNTNPTGSRVKLTTKVWGEGRVSRIRPPKCKICWVTCKNKNNKYYRWLLTIFCFCFHWGLIYSQGEETNQPTSSKENTALRFDTSNRSLWNQYSWKYLFKVEYNGWDSNSQPLTS